METTRGTKHTPGPWTIHDHPTAPCEIRGPNGQDVAAVWAADLEGGLENARLIAAAPDMLEALEEVRRSIVPGVLIARGPGIRLCNLIDAAIAKAEGSA